MFPNQNAPSNSIKQIIAYLNKNPFRTERQIQEDVFGFYRAENRESNKKYADMLRRGIYNGTIRKLEVTNKRFKFIYFT
jgi:hypothetical protein